MQHVKGRAMRSHLLGEKTFIISATKWAHTFIALHNTMYTAHNLFYVSFSFHYFLSVMMCTTRCVVHTDR